MQAQALGTNESGIYVRTPALAIEHGDWRHIYRAYGFAVLPISLCCSMPDDAFTLRVSFLMGFFVVFSFFIGWYFRRDPTVRPLCRLVHVIRE